MSKRDYTVLVNFGKPWRVRCRSDLTGPKYKNRQKNGCFQVGDDGVWYLPVYTGSKSDSERIAATLKTISASM